MEDIKTSDVVDIMMEDNAEMLAQIHQCTCTKYEENAKVIQKFLGHRYRRANDRHFSCEGDGLIFPAKDVKVNRPVIIKIIPTDKRRGKEMYSESTDYSMDLDEIARLKAISDFSGRGKMFCALMEDYMYLGWHAGIVFSQYGPDLYELTHQRGPVPLMLDDLATVAFQIIHAVKFLHDNGLAHMDVKPENVVTICGEYQEIEVENGCFRNEERSSQIFLKMKDPRVRIVDFGSSEFFSENHGVPLHGNTLLFRAPEVILQLDCNYQADKWSIGCTLMELYYAGSLFPIVDEDDLNHLATIHNAISPIPQWMISAAEGHAPYDEPGLSNAIWERSLHKRTRILPLENMFIFGADPIAKARFQSLIHKLLRVNPNRRIKLTDALKLPYFDSVPGYIHIDCELD